MSNAQEEERIREAFERTKRMIKGHEEGKREAIRNLALELENMGIPPELVGEQMIRGLEGYASERYIRECLDKKYKWKRTEKIGKFSDLSTNKVLEEEEKKPIVIDTEGRPAKEENEITEEEDPRSESRIEDTVQASIKSHDEKPVWLDMNRGELLNVIEALREDSARNTKRMHELEDKNREVLEQLQQSKKENDKDETVKQKDSIIDMQEKVIKQLRNETAELKQALAERQAFKAASEITPQEDLVSENKALRAENEVLKKQRQLNLEPSPVIMDCSKFDMFTYRKSKIKIIHDGERVTQIIPIKRAAGEVNL